jgi:hypothetical protein
MNVDVSEEQAISRKMSRIFQFAAIYCLHTQRRQDLIETNMANKRLRPEKLFSSSSGKPNNLYQKLS